MTYSLKDTWQVQLINRFADLPNLMVLFLHFYDKKKHAEHTAHLEEAVRRVQGCVPKEANLGQIVDVFCKYLKEKPAERHRGGAALLDEAIQRDLEM